VTTRAPYPSRDYTLTFLYDPSNVDSWGDMHVCSLYTNVFFSGLSGVFVAHSIGFHVGLPITSIPGNCSACNFLQRYLPFSHVRCSLLALNSSLVFAGRTMYESNHSNSKVLSVIPPPLPSDHAYTSCYCEENIYLLAQTFLASYAEENPNTLPWEVYVVFISNNTNTV